MHFTIPLLSLLTTGALALPNPMDSKRDFSYDGPVAPDHHCPGKNPHTILNTQTSIFGAPPNYPNYACLPMSTEIDWIGINLDLSNSSALQAFSDDHCADRIAYILWPQAFGDGNDQFCVKQSETGGKGSWKSVLYVR